MELIIAIALPVLFITAIVAVAFRVATVSVYGRAIPDAVLTAWLEKKLPRMTLNGYDSSILHELSDCGKTYISDCGIDVFAKYHIRGVGTVPRWSKSARLIDARFAELGGRFAALKD